MKNQKGITLIILASTIIIMALIVGTISYTSLSNYNMIAFYNMRSDIELLDEKIAIYYLEKETIPIIETDAVTIDAIYNANNPSYNPNNDPSHALYRINLSELDNLSLNYKDYYIDKTSHTIYLATGVKIEEETYFTVPYDYEEVN